MSTPTQPQLVITRVFDAPRELVFKAFSESERLAQWWGPKGCEIHVASLTFQTGGVFHYSMKVPNGGLLWGKFIYGEIVPPELIEFINSFSDEQGNLTRNPWLAVWPLEIRNLLTLVENAGKTTLTLKGSPINATPEEMQAFEKEISGMQQGFKGSLDQLDEYLAREQG